MRPRQHPERLARARAAGMRLRGALDVEHARTAAAEQLATELSGRVEDLRVWVALRMAPFVA